MTTASDVSRDVIVIGSGIGGLSCAITLAKLGYNVTVVEKNSSAGGLMRGYVRNGIDCPVGVHYMGALGKGQALRRLFEYLGIFEHIPLERMGTNGIIDRYIFDDFIFDLPEGIDAFQENLNKGFPDEKQKIAVLIAMMKDMANKINSLSFLYASSVEFSDLDQFKPMGEILDGLGCSPALRSVLGVPSYLIGIPFDECPAVYYYMTLSSYLFSSWRLKCASTQMAQACIKSFERLGGRIICGDPVKNIIVNSKIAEGVELDSGRIFHAANIVAAVHPKTALSMIPEEKVRASYRKRVSGLEDTDGVFSIHAVVDATSKMGMEHNIYKLSANRNGGNDGLIFTQVRRCEKPGANLLSIVTPSKYEEWKNWENTKSGNRGGDYLEKKAMKAEELIQTISQFLAPLSGVKLLDTYTPLTIRDWVNSPSGSTYGILKSSHQLLKTIALHRTPIMGLHLAGQSIMSPGILGTIIGSMRAVSHIVGSERFEREVNLRG
jgi:all-trans-retinol 13,14-reductase